MELKRLYFKNILSFGNVMTDLDFSDIKSGVVIYGQNGNGKSVILEALNFALFGKPYRNIKLSELINRTNCANLVCGVEFINGGDSLYRIERGLGPDYVKIFKDGEEVAQEVSKSEMQKLVNKTIGVDYKIFAQIAAIDSLFYKPFMNLASAERRFIIDNIFGLILIGDMSKKMKEYDVKIEQKITKVNNDIMLTKERILIHEQNEKNRRDEKIVENEANISMIKDRIASLVSQQQTIKFEIDEHSKGLSKASEVLNSMNKSLNKKEREISSLEHTMAGLEHDLEDAKNGVCEKCKQTYANKEERIQGINAKMIVLQSEMGTRKGELITIVAQSEIQSCDVKSLEEIITTKRIELKTLQRQVDSEQSALLDIELVQDKLNESDGDDKEDILILKDAEAKFDKDLLVNKTMGSYVKICQKILTDDGIRYYILKNYLPFFNKLIRKYLDLMECNIRFTFDNSFNQIIDFNYKNSLNYEALSAGQKQRINLALLFAFIEFAETKSSTKFDFIVCDEILDGSGLDTEGKEVIINILKNHISKKMIIITHNHEIQDMFEKKIKVEKHGNFSQVEWK